MRRFFSKSGGRPPSTSKAASVAAASTPSPITPHTTGLQPKYIVPPIPHPHPYDHISLLVTKDALLLRPHISGHGSSASYVKLSWGKSVKIEELSGDANDAHDWTESIMVYGIVGILELFSASYLLVITAKKDVGNLFDSTHSVYCVKGVTAIPLIEDKARMSVNTLASRNLAASRPSLLPSATMDSIGSAGPDEGSLTSNPQSQSTSPRVQFSEPERAKSKVAPAPLPLSSYPNTFSLNTDEHSISRSPSDSTSELSLSGYTTPSSIDSSSPASPIAKALASRLSFWSRLSKRSSLFPASPDEVGFDAKPKVPASLTLADEQARLDALMSGEIKEEPEQVIESILSATAPPPESTEEKHSELEDKIIRECIREFVKGGMFYAYNFDITRSLQHKQDQVAKARKQHALLADLDALPKSSEIHPYEGDKVDPLTEPNATLPLWRRVDKQYWWNEWLAKPFIDAGLHSYILPIMQGYYQIASFHVPLGLASETSTEEEPPLRVDYVVVSRRSRDRAGLRYQRRGVDDEAHVANFVESETIMRVERDGITNIFSYVQIRGSIPLFWTQTGYGLKPLPVLSTDRTRTQNLDAMKRHFQRTIPLFGPHTVINLAEQHGKEASVTHAYREYMAELDMEGAKYHEYDFHTETKGMKYENISKLIDAMEKTFDQQGYLWISDGTVMSQQKGVFRVNCIDCLDRTNVVQSAFARYVLNKQLSAVALLNPSAEGKTETDTVFNDVWANNGDAISRAYAGTSALKGDFTRTGKRDLSGLLNDGVNSLARMYTSTFSDWFCQAVIDFMLGNRTLTVFSEFLLKLQSTDPRDLIRLSKIRAEAIATSVSRCLAEGERLLAGWTLFGPEELCTKVGDKFEEKVLLLSATALFIVSYDYTLEKVKLYTRVPLGDIVSITKGAYIISPLEEASRDPLQNAGFVISWLKNNETTRMTSYSVRNSLESGTSCPSSPVVAKAPIPVPASAPIKQIKFLGGGMPFSIPSPIPSRSSTPAPRGQGGSPSRGSRLSSILTNVSLGSASGESNISYAAFKMLPIDPTRARRSGSVIGSSVDDGGEYADAADELMGAENCKAAVDVVVECIRKACVDVGSRGSEAFVRDEDVVGLGEAQKMTSVYAKMEYGVKRLLWLGG